MLEDRQLTAEYQAARTVCIVVIRSDRAFVRVSGRDPVRMVNGLLTNDVAGLAAGQANRSALLTPRGRMLAEIRTIRRANDLLLETDAAARANVLDTIRKYVPPLFARGEDASAAISVIGVYGPAAGSTVASALDARAVASPQATAPAGAGDTIAERDISAIDTDYAGVPGIDLIVPAQDADPMVRALVECGATTAGAATLEILRIEAGQPRWGADLDETVIPLEAGLKDALISTTKGCYTGQEVIIRILHRGHVNRHLRGMVLANGPVPERGTKLFRESDARAMGEVTSAGASPRMRAVIALGYVRREIEPGALMRVGEPGGPQARIVTLPFEHAAGEDT